MCRAIKPKTPQLLLVRFIATQLQSYYLQTSGCSHAVPMVLLHCSTMVFLYTIYHAVTTCAWPYAMSIKQPDPEKVGTSWPWVTNLEIWQKLEIWHATRGFQYLICFSFLLNPFWPFFVILRYCVHHDPVCPGI